MVQIVAIILAGMSVQCDSARMKPGVALPYQSFARVVMDLAAPPLERGFVYELDRLEHLERLAALDILPDLESASFYLKDAAYIGLLVVPQKNSRSCCQYLTAVSAVETDGSTLVVEMSTGEITGACNTNNCIIEYIPAELLIVKRRDLDTFDVRYDGEHLPARPLP